MKQGHLISLYNSFAINEVKNAKSNKGFGAMGLDRMIEEIKRIPGSADHVGMLLCHEGVVRSWARNKRKSVRTVQVEVDQSRVEELRQEFENYPGIFKVAIETEEGLRYPGDELLRLVVAGDIRENVIPALTELLDRVKGEAIHKEEEVSE